MARFAILARLDSAQSTRKLKVLAISRNSVPYLQKLDKYCKFELTLRRI